MDHRNEPTIDELRRVVLDVLRLTTGKPVDDVRVSVCPAVWNGMEFMAVGLNPDKHTMDGLRVAIGSVEVIRDGDGWSTHVTIRNITGWV